MSVHGKHRLVYAIIKFLQEEATSGGYPDDKIESIEVARQCLETAYGLDIEANKNLDLEVPLLGIVETCPGKKEVTDQDKMEAEKMKVEGNEAMKKEEFSQALEAYSKAIEVDPYNAVYFSNRAAAFNKLERFPEAILDCDEAISLDPKYSKAYGRKGLALSGMNNHAAAIDMYKKALEMDPTNQNLKNNLEIAQEKAQSSTGGPAGMAGLGGMAGMPGMAGLGGLLGGQMPDIAGMLQNPGFMQMAQQMMSDPNMQSMLQNMMSGMQGQPGGGAGGAGGAGAPDIQNLLSAGAQFAQTMQQEHPEIVDQLRSRMDTGTNQNNANQDNNENPDNNAN